MGDYNHVRADMQWYGCQPPEALRHWQSSDSLPYVTQGVLDRVKEGITEFLGAHDVKNETLASLQHSWNAFESRKVFSTDLEAVKADIHNMLYIHQESKDTVFDDLIASHHQWDAEPWRALEAAAAVDVADGGDVQKVIECFVRAHRVISMAYVGGTYKAQAVAASDPLVGERILLCSILVGQEQIKLGCDQFWVRQCPNLRLMTYRAMCGAYARGVLAHGECTMYQVFKAGATTPSMTGNVMWSRVRDAYTMTVPHELGDMFEKRMREARANFPYPSNIKRDVKEMTAWIDVTLLDWYAVCGPSAENMSCAGVATITLAYEAELLLDMCQGVTYEDYMAFIVASLETVPHMDSKEILACVFAAHACGVKGYPALEWLHACIDEHKKSGGTPWVPRLVEGTAYSMFLGINEACRRPVIPYGETRVHAEVNLIAAHEVGGLFRHGMEGDAMSRSVLGGDSTVASFPKMIDTIAEQAISIAGELGPPHSTGFMLTSFACLLHNLQGTSGMLRWASQAKPLCDSIATPEQLENSTPITDVVGMTRDVMKVSTLAAHRVLRLGVCTDYTDTHSHTEDGDCVCWECIAEDDSSCLHHY
jgi:hypothetical protein